MAYLNYTNPHDLIKKDWIQIEGKNEDEQRTEIKKTEDVGGIFGSLLRGEKNVDAGFLQEELESRGIRVSHDPAMVPNGITVSSAGILISLVDAPSAREMKTIEESLIAAKSRVRVASKLPPESSRKDRGERKDQVT